MCESEIVKFFEDQTIFITGGTGFLGKVLVEKLLRVCRPKQIYILTRSKKGKSVDERYKDFFNYACFSGLKGNDAVLNRVAFVNGDSEKPNLGLSLESEHRLVAETSIIIHAAANVKFDTPLRSAAASNVGSTMFIVNLAKQMVNLKKLIYVSTAYSNCPRKHIEEKIYPTPITSKELFLILEGIRDDKVLDDITPKIIGEWPNTYTFTKAIAENHLKAESENLPIAIVRPAIVGSTYEEPILGWIDNFYGVVGITVAAALGVLKSMNARKDAVALLVPCDYVANLVMAAAAQTSNKKSDLVIYNFAGTKNNPITWGEYMKHVEFFGYKHPTIKIIGHYHLRLIANTTLHKIRVFFLHTMVAYLVDFIMLCLKKKPLAVANYTKLDRLVSLTTYFALREWEMDSQNLDDLWSNMTNSDKCLFNFNLHELDWSEYVRRCVIGARVHLLKDPLETIPEGHKRARWLRVAYYSFLGLLLILLCYLLKFIFSCFSDF